MPRRKKFSIFWFSVQMLGQLAVLVLGIRFFLPGVWAKQIAAGPLAFALTFAAIHMALAFFEWAFHRYVLHSITFKVLALWARGHRNHHGLTPIRLQPVAAGSDRYILNRYPIIESEQFEDSAFPVYAFIAFTAIFTPLFVGVQFLVPQLPVLFGGFAAIAFSMALYEILHAVEHRPYEWWKHATEHPRFGKLWTKIYGFHHMHHANISCNEAISGFFGLPIADWVLGTYHQPKALLLEGRMATAKDFAVTPPPPLVRAIDGWARKREARFIREGHAPVRTVDKARSAKEATQTSPTVVAVEPDVAETAAS